MEEMNIQSKYEQKETIPFCQGVYNKEQLK